MSKRKIWFFVVCIVFLFLNMQGMSVDAQEEEIEIEEQDLETGKITTYMIQGCDGEILCETPEDSRGNISEPYSIIGTDDRNVVTETNRIPYRFIGKLDINYSNGKRGDGTAFLVGKNTLLTAGHCAYEPGTTIKKIVFSPALKGNELPFGSYNISKIHVPTKYKEAANAGDNDNKEKYDYALLQLASNVGSTIGYFQLGGYNTQYNINNLTNTKATIAGYPAEYLQMYRHKSNILGFNEGGYYMYYDIDTVGGQSGSPVIKYVDGKYYVIGIHIEGSSTYNIGRYITGNIYELVKKYK